MKILFSKKNQWLTNQHFKKYALLVFSNIVQHPPEDDQSIKKKKQGIVNHHRFFSESTLLNKRFTHGATAHLSGLYAHYIQRFKSYLEFFFSWAGRWLIDVKHRMKLNLHFSWRHHGIGCVGVQSGIFQCLSIKFQLTWAQFQHRAASAENLFHNFLLSRNEQDTSHRLYIRNDSLAGNLILVRLILLCLATFNAALWNWVLLFKGIIGCLL